MIHPTCFPVVVLLATALSAALDCGWEYGVPAHAAASFVAYGRVESLQHHPQDVVAGAAIGILSSYIFTKPYQGWKASIEGDTKSVALRLSHAF